MIVRIIKKIRRIKRLFLNFKTKLIVHDYGINLKVNNKSKFTKKTTLGNNCNFNGIRIMGNGNVIIGDNFHSGSECLMLTSNHNYDNGKAIPYDDTYIDKNIIIEDNVWIGTRVLILGGVKIGEGAIIQAGSVVSKDIPKYGIAGGNPAVVFKYRNIDHYKNLKNNNMFH